MTTRRKLGSSLETNKLSPEEIALVEGAKPVSIQVKTKTKEDDNNVAGGIEPEPKRDESNSETQPSKPKAKVPKQKKQSLRRATGNAAPSDDVLVTDSFKLYKGIQNRLLRASFERKVEKTAPYTKQAIVNKALDSWLSDNGF